MTKMYDLKECQEVFKQYGYCLNRMSKYPYTHEIFIEYENILGIYRREIYKNHKILVKRYTNEDYKQEAYVAFMEAINSYSMNVDIHLKNETTFYEYADSYINECINKLIEFDVEIPCGIHLKELLSGVENKDEMSYKLVN